VAAAGQRAQRGDDRRVGQLGVAEVDAVAPEDAGVARAGGLDEVVDQAALADARLAGDEDEAALVRGRTVERRVELGELDAASDEGVGGDAGGHVGSMFPHAPPDFEGDGVRGVHAWAGRRRPLTRRRRTDPRRWAAR
jgi:hypothetical protein